MLGCNRRITGRVPPVPPDQLISVGRDQRGSLGRRNVRAVQGRDTAKPQNQPPAEGGCGGVEVVRVHEPVCHIISKVRPIGLDEHRSQIEEGILPEDLQKDRSGVRLLQGLVQVELDRKSVV